MDDEFAEVHGDDFYAVFTNDEAKPGMVYFSMTSREGPGKQVFDVDQYFSYKEIQTFARELVRVLQRVVKDKDD